MRRTILGAVLAALVVACPAAEAGKNPAPAQSSTSGKTLAEWMRLYWTWNLGGPQDGRVGKVVFLPLPAGQPSEDDPTIFVGETDVTLAPGEKFVLPMFVFIGETYLEDIPDDQPAPEEAFTGAEVVIKLDGKTILDGSKDDLSAFYFEPFFFDEPILYDEPTEYAPDVHAIGAVWVQGIGFVHGPLTKGKHTLTLFVYSDVFHVGFANTWHITVK